MAATGPSSAAPATSAREERLNRWTLVTIWTVLTVWSVCLWVISGRALGCCWAGMVESAAAELLAVAVALALPGVFLRVLFSLAMRIRPGKALALQVVLTARGGAASPRQAKAPLRVLAMAAAGCAVGGFISTFGVALASWALHRLATIFLYPAWTWAVVRVAVGVVLMLPMAVAAAAVVLVGGLLGRRGRRDPHRRLLRDLLTSGAAGLVLASGLWWAEVNLLAVAFGCAAALVAVAAASASRHHGPVRAVRPGAGDDLPGRRRRQRLSNIVIWAVLAWGLALQCRALKDATGADWSLGWLWAASAAGALAVASGRRDRRPGVGEPLEARASACGAVWLAVVQAGLLVLAAAGGPGRWAWVALAWAGQAPLAVLAADVLVRRRRLFSASGYPGRFYLADAALGMAVGALLATRMLAWPTGGRTVIVAALACLTAAAWAGARAAAGAGERAFGRPSGRPMTWALAAAGMILSAALVSGGAARAGRERLGGRVAVGASLTAVQAPGGEVAVLGSPAPGVPDRLTPLAQRLIRSRPGRWWLVPGRRPDLLDELGKGLRPIVYFPERAMGSLPAYRAAGQAEDFTRYLNIHTQPLDGVYLSGLPADHPDAWCLYNRHVLDRCRGHLAAGGMMLVHVRAGPRGLADVLSVARTFASAFGSGTAAVAVTPGGLEVLLVDCPALSNPHPLSLAGLTGASEAAVMPATALAEDLPGTRPAALSVLSPRRRGRTDLSLSGFAYWVERRGR